MTAEKENIINDDKPVLPNKWWSNFFEKFKEIDSLKVSQWKETHHLAYICKRYESLYGRKFSFSFKSSPGKCPEMVLVKKIGPMLGTSNQSTIKQYIDWVFDEKIIPKNMHLRSLGFLTLPGLGNEFLAARAKAKIIQKTTTLPKEYQSIVDKFELPIQTYGDLAFAKNAVEEYPNDESRLPYKNMLNELYCFGFDATLLNNLK